MPDVVSTILSIVSIVVGGGIATFLVKRHFDRLDKYEDERVTAYREVWDSIAAYRAAMDRLEDFDWNQPPRHEDFKPTNDLHEKTRDLIEQHRADTGSAFADAAKSVIEFWDLKTHYMWEHNYNAEPIKPSIEELLLLLRDEAIPERYRSRVAPGHFEELKSKTK